MTDSLWGEVIPKFDTKQSKLQQVADRKKAKYVPDTVQPDATQSKEVDPEVKSLALNIGLLYMGMKDVLAGLSTLETFVNGTDVNPSNYEDELEGIRHRVNSMESRLNKALEVQDEQ